MQNQETTAPKEIDIYHSPDDCYLAMVGKRQIGFVCFEQFEDFEDSPRFDSPDIIEVMQIHTDSGDGNGVQYRDQMCADELDRKGGAINALANEFPESVLVYQEGAMPRTW